MIDDDTNSIKSVSLSNEIMDTNKTDSKESLIETSKNNIICCCVSNNWCFKHQGLSAYKSYDVNDCICFECLDCCTWCLEFKQSRTSWICKKKTICFMCCFSITFH
jgi:hypothetical protein